MSFSLGINWLSVYFLSDICLLCHCINYLSQFASSFFGESTLPPNLLLPTNLMDPARLSESKTQIMKNTDCLCSLCLRCPVLSGLVFPATERPPPPKDCTLPLLRKCDAVVPAHLSPIQTWVETLESLDSEPLGLAELHPDVFAVPPRC